MGGAELIALISAITALCAVVLGPLVSLWGASKQYRVSVLSNNRQAWINALRDTIAELISIASLITLPQDAGDQVKSAQRLLFLSAKIELMMNPNEVDHRLLMGLLNELQGTIGAALSKKSSANDGVAALLQKIVPLSQAILKREWKRVKAVE
jgi:hypothetical protein